MVNLRLYFLGFLEKSMATFAENSKLGKISLWVLFFYTRTACWVRNLYNLTAFHHAHDATGQHVRALVLEEAEIRRRFR